MLKDFIMTKQLIKPLSEYQESVSLPHVTVAKRIFKDKPVAGHLIHYVICETGD